MQPADAAAPQGSAFMGALSAPVAGRSGECGDRRKAAAWCAEDNPHGHFSTTNVPCKLDGDPAEAEADLRRAFDALNALKDDLAIAEARTEAIEEKAHATPEEEADVTQRMEVVQREI